VYFQVVHWLENPYLSLALEKKLTNVRMYPPPYPSFSSFFFHYALLSYHFLKILLKLKIHCKFHCPFNTKYKFNTEKQNKNSQKINILQTILKNKVTKQSVNPRKARGVTM